MKGRDDSRGEWGLLLVLVPDQIKCYMMMFPINILIDGQMF